MTPLSTRLGVVAGMLHAAGKPVAADEVRRLVRDVVALEAEVSALARTAAAVRDSHDDLSDVACGAREYAAEQMAVQALAIAQGLGVRPGAAMRLPRVPGGGR